MTRLVPDQEWWTAEEIAAAKLPDLPGTRQGVEATAKRYDWRGQPAFARRRDAQGGGWEYSWQPLSARARRKLLTDRAEAAQPARRGRDEVWQWYEQLPATVQERAQDRLKIVQEVEALERQDGRDVAVRAVARLRGIGARTIWGWFALIEGVRTDDRLPYLAPRNRAAEKRGGQPKDCDPAFFDLLVSDFLRDEEPTFTDCYRRALRVAKKESWNTLPERTMRRRVDAAVPESIQILARKGVEAHKRRYPPQVRDKTALGALEAVNADFHKFDVFVLWPGANGGPDRVLRPQLVAFQDVHSGRILSWRVDVSANSTAVMLAAGDMIAEYGIPENVVLDNGREFAAKAISGGSETRFRWPVRADEIPGLFTALGVEIHWATPYSGQSKQIERAWRDFAQTIAKDPRFAGAYTGNKVDAKPENYQSRAVPLDEFLRVLAEGIEEHNMRQGRRSEVAFGRSFAEVFADSYEKRMPRKATEAQRRLWLLGAKGLTADRQTGAVWFEGNEFWADWMGALAGQRVIIRFDPENFWDGLHIYDAANAYLGHAPARQKIGYFDAAESRDHAKARGDWQKAEKAALRALRKLNAMQIGQTLDALDPTPPAAPVEAKVVRGVFGKASGKAKSARAEQPAGLRPEELEAAREKVADLTTRRAPKPVEETARERFRRVLELERALERGDPVTAEQQRLLSVYQTSSEYRAERRLWDVHGDELFG